MKISEQIATHHRAVFFGGNWTVSDLKTHLADVTWQEAVMQVHGLNSIATLVFHLSYFVRVVTKVLQGAPLSGSDKDSFGHPPILSQEDWEKMLAEVWVDAETFAHLIEQLPDEKLWEDFSDQKYGNYYRNLHGIIEHTHYHLGQIVVIKKIVRGNVS